METVLDVDLPRLEEISFVTHGLRPLKDLNWPAIAQRIIASNLQHLLRIRLVDLTHFLPTFPSDPRNVDREVFVRELRDGAFRGLGFGVELCFQLN